MTVFGTVDWGSNPLLETLETLWLLSKYKAHANVGVQKN